MNKIDPTHQEMRSFKLKVRHLQDSHQSEIENIKSTNLENRKHLKAANTEEVDVIRDQHQQNIGNELQKKEVVLNDMKNQIKSSQDSMDNRLDNIKNTNSNQIRNQESNHKLKYTTEDIKNQDTVQRLNSNFNNKVFELSRSGRESVSNLRTQNETAVRTQNRQHSNATRELNEKYNTKFRFEKNKFDSSLEIQQQEFKNQTAQIKKQHFVELENNNSEHKKKMEVIKSKHAGLIKSEKQNFDGNYKHLLEQNRNISATLEGKTVETLQDLKNKFSQDLDVHLDKVQDSFYHTRKITPVITDKGDHFEIKLKIPPHEKKFVQLYAKDKKIRITLSRNYDEKFTDQKDITNSTKKTETHVLEAKVDQFLNNKEITTHYDKQHLTYKIKKA
ncbi:MAG: hypothetical protein ACI9QD_000807 [Thermoproteota archaeon]|jgi:hypothetical protein